jgi:hypothetical protein
VALLSVTLLTLTSDIVKSGFVLVGVLELAVELFVVLEVEPLLEEDEPLEVFLVLPPADVDDEWLLLLPELELEPVEFEPIELDEPVTV